MQIRDLKQELDQSKKLYDQTREELSVNKELVQSMSMHLEQTKESLESTLLQNEDLSTNLTEKQAFIQKLDYINCLRESQNKISVNQNDEMRVIIDKMAQEKNSLATIYEERIRDIRDQLNAQILALTETNEFNLEYVKTLQR